MITIERIYLRNFRAIGEAEVLPLTDGGMTALNGANGAGKSSVLSGLLFALYGVTPDGVSIPALRRQGSDRDDCRVEVTFVYDGQRMTVERGLKGPRDATYVKIIADGVEQAFGKVRAAQEWLVNRLGGLDAEAFLTVVAVRQKELDGLVKASPADRRKLVERLAGIDRIFTALQSARDEERDVKRQLEVMPGSQEDVTAAEQTLDAAQQAATGLWELHEQAQRAADVADRDFDIAKDAAREMEQAQAEHRALESVAMQGDNAASRLDVEANAAEQALTDLIGQAEGGDAEALRQARAAHDAATTALNDNRDAQAAVVAARERSDHDKRSAATANRRASAAVEQARFERQAVEDAQKQLAEFGDKDAAHAEASAAAQEVADLNEKIGALRGEWNRLSKAVAALETATSPCCPTCETPLQNAEALLSTLIKQRDTAIGDGKRLAEQAAAKKDEADRLADRVRARAALVEQVTTLTARAERAEAAAEEAAAEAVEASQLAETSEQNAVAAERAAAEAIACAEALTAAVRDASAVLRRVENAAAAAERIPEARRTATAKRQAASEAARQASEARAAENAARVDVAQQGKVMAACAEAEALARSSARAARDAEVAWQVANEQVNAATRVFDTERAKLAAKVSMMADYELKAATKDALDAFRRDRIARLAPELSEIASDLIPRMTNGRFVAVELDEEFTPVLTDRNGNQRPVSWLSGGEESNVALALRIAIREVVGGARGGVMILDEVLTAQDEQRRQATMAAIRELPGLQPIVINHVSEATDMVDLVLDVVPDEINGSTVVPAEAYGVVSEADVDAA